MRMNLSRILWIVIAFIAVMAALSIVSIFFFGRTPYTGGYGFMGNFPAYGMFVFMPIMAAMSILVIFLILYFVLGFFGHVDQQIHGYSEAVEILKQRYAKGEISEEEYRKKLSEIRDR